MFLYEIFPNKSVKVLFITMKQDSKYNPQLFAPCHSDCDSMCWDGASLTLIWEWLWYVWVPPCLYTLDKKQEICEQK